MKPSVYRISLDVHDAHSSVCLDMKRQDTARQINITLTDGGFPYRISEECYAVFSATKADGKRLLHHCDIHNNTVQYIVRTQTTAAVGPVECEIKLYGANDKLLFSPGFNILVSDNAMEEDDDLISEDDVDELTHLISEAARIIAEGNEMISDGNELIEDMNEKRETLDQQIQETAEYARTASRAAASADIARSGAENAASLAVNNANAAKASENNAKTSEDNAKTSAQTAVNMANAAKGHEDAAAAAAARAEEVARRVENGELDGKDGATFIPRVRDDGYLEWYNYSGAPNPAPAYIKGNPGDPGKSAYQYAVDGGFKGTEEEFAELMANGGASVQPDWNQNDPDAPDYVKNRTHWVEGEQSVIRVAADSVTDVIDVEGKPYLCRVSDATPTVADLTGKVLELSQDGEVFGSISISEDLLANSEEIAPGCWFITVVEFNLYVTYVDNFTFKGVTFGRKGCYAYKALLDAMGDENYAYSIVLGGAIHQLDEKFIPDTIARTKDIQMPTELPNPEKLTFSGIASGEYDGSKPLDLNIPATVKDWEQNNPGEADYIKNRTHWDEITTELIFSSKGWKLAPDNTDSPTWWKNQIGGDGKDATLPSHCIGYVLEIDGKKIRAEHKSENDYTWFDPNYDGKVYERYVWIGNGALITMTGNGEKIPDVVDTGETYVFYRRYYHSSTSSTPYYNDKYHYCTTVEAASVDISVWDISGVTAHPLDERFIPDTIARVKDIPAAVTDEHINELINSAMGDIEAALAKI